MYQDIRMQIRLNAPPDRLWRALTTSDAVAAWFAESADIDLGAKKYDFWGKYTPTTPDRAAGSHSITEATPERSLSFDWHFDGDDTRVTFNLIPDGSGTILTLRHGQAPGGASVEAPNGNEDFWFLSLENLRRHLDGKPSDARVDYSNPMRGDIRHETTIDAPASRVFDVLTKPDELNHWIATDAKVTPEVGGDYAYGWMYEGMDMGAAKIIDIVPNRRISAQTPDHGPEYPPSVMTWELSESGGKTRVVFTHSGFADDADVAGIYTGWRNFLNWVRSLSEYGADWQLPVTVLKPDAIAFPKSMYAAQSQLVDSIRA